MQWVLDSLNDIVVKLDKIIDFAMKTQAKLGTSDFQLIADDLMDAKQKIQAAADAGARGHGFKYKDHTHLPPWIVSDLKKHNKRP
jgi:hypothetical protein